MLGDQPRGGAFVVHTPQDADFKTDKKFMIAAKEKMEIKVESGKDGPGSFKLEPKDALEISGGTTIKLKGKRQDRDH